MKELTQHGVQFLLKSLDPCIKNLSDSFLPLLVKPRRVDLVNAHVRSLLVSFRFSLFN